MYTTTNLAIYYTAKLNAWLKYNHVARKCIPDQPVRGVDLWPKLSNLLHHMDNTVHME